MELISDLLSTGVTDLSFEVARTTLRTALNMGRNGLLLGYLPGISIRGNEREISEAATAIYVGQQDISIVCPQQHDSHPGGSSLGAHFTSHRHVLSQTPPGGRNPRWVLPPSPRFSIHLTSCPNPMSRYESYDITSESFRAPEWATPPQPDHPGSHTSHRAEKRWYPHIQ